MREVRWSDTPNFKNFPVCCDQHKGFSEVNEAEINVFLKLPCFHHDPVNAGNLISGSSMSLKLSLCKTLGFYFLCKNTQCGYVTTRIYAQEIRCMEKGPWA